MDTPIHVSPILTVNRPAEKLKRFLEAEWEIYDGAPVAQDAKLTLLDILVSVSMNSRLDTADKVKSVWDSRDSVEKGLNLVPGGVSLTDENVPWDGLKVLFDVFCAVRYVKEAVATKILHRKRPALIPIIDSIVAAYLNDSRTCSLPRAISIGDRLVGNMRCFREQLLGCLSQITALCEMAALEHRPITPVRALEILIWTAREPRGYYRKGAGEV